MEVILDLHHGNIGTCKRCSKGAIQLCDILVRDIHFSDKTSIKLLGKGGKARKVTIPVQCAALLKDYLSSENKLASLDSHVFSNQTNEHITISCVEEIV